MNYSEHSSQEMRELRDIESRLASITRWFGEAPTDELEAVEAAIEWNAPIVDAENALSTTRRLLKSHRRED